MATLIHIRSPKDGRYLGAMGGWCVHRDAARTFHSAVEAEQFCQSEHLTEVELIITRENQPPLTVRVKFDV